MLNGGVLLEFAVAAVVVGGDEALVGDNLAGAEVPEGATVVAEAHDGVFETALVDAVDVLGREFETGFLHVGIAFSDEREQPHAFVGIHFRHCANECQKCCNKEFFHWCKFIFVFCCFFCVRVWVL